MAGWTGRPRRELVKRAERNRREREGGPGAELGLVSTLQLYIEQDTHASTGTVLGGFPLPGSDAVFKEGDPLSARLLLFLLHKSWKFELCSERARLCSA